VHRTCFMAVNRATATALAALLLLHNLVASADAQLSDGSEHEYRQVPGDCRIGHPDAPGPNRLGPVGPTASRTVGDVAPQAQGPGPNVRPLMAPTPAGEAAPSPTVHPSGGETFTGASSLHLLSSCHPEHLADLDRDGDVDLADFARFQACHSGPGRPLPALCHEADFDNDGDADLHDFAVLQVCFNGPDLSPSAICPVVQRIPPRPPDAVGGSRFIAEVAALPLIQREQRVLAELLCGNLPEFLRRFVPVHVSATGPRGTPHTGAYEVMPDYLAIGGDADWVRMPMRPQTAQQVADSFGCVLPTRKMVDDIHRAAVVKLAPQPFTPSAQMTTVPVFWRHHQEIERRRHGLPPGWLIAGIKKDVVITPELARRPHCVAIYGWHRPDGAPIQPLYVGHESSWVDYSHGVRLVRGVMTVDGVRKTVVDVLADPETSPLLSDEGVVEVPRY